MAIPIEFTHKQIKEIIKYFKEQVDNLKRAYLRNGCARTAFYLEQAISALEFYEKKFLDKKIFISLEEVAKYRENYNHE